MNKIAGKVLLKETGVGISNLLITIYDLDPDTKPEELITIGKDKSIVIGPGSQQIPGDRIGSVLTNESGDFELSLEDVEFRIRNEQEKRPDYLLLVLAPEELGKDFNMRILYASTSIIRQNAGRIENYIIRLTEEQLQKAEIEIPTEANDDPQNIIDSIEQSDINLSTIDAGVKSHQIEKLKARQNIDKEFDEKIKPELVKALSFVPGPGRNKITAEETEVPDDGAIKVKNFVLPGQSVKKATDKVIDQGIDKKFNNGKALSGFVGISAEKIQKLQELQGDDTGDSFEITEDEFNTIFFKEENNENDSEEQEEPRSTILLKDDLVAKLCREKTLGELCLLEEDEDPNDGEGDADNGTIGGKGIDTITSEDIPKFIASLIGSMTSPEESVSFGVNQPSRRASQEDIQNNVDALRFKAGPADAVSFHDFHNLQIAFEHVWQEALDEGILKLAEDAYKEIVELGGDPVNENATSNCTYLPMLFSLPKSSGRSPQPTREIIEKHWAKEVRVFEKYAVVKLPISTGVQIWNPAQIVQGPDDIMYTGLLQGLSEEDIDVLLSYLISLYQENETGS